MTGSANDNAWTLQYTNAHQLTSEAASIANYKWQQPTTSTGTDNYSAVSTLNQYPTVTPSGGSAQTQTHDGNGNLTGDGTLTYSYDPENRLVSACNTSACSGTMSAAYAYDPLGRRQEKSGTGVPATVFLQDGDDEIAEYDTSGNVQRRFVPGSAIDEPIAMVPASGTTELFYTDHHGSIVATSDASGNLIEGPFTYDPYGNCYSGTSACSTLSGGEPFKFTGQYLDPETGCYYYRARYYCADPLRGGRFLQTDPVGYTSDLNLYTYVGNDPADRSDLTGMYDCSGSNQDCLAIANFVGAINKAVANFDRNSQSRKTLSTISQYLGKPGDNNGVTIQATALKGAVSEARGNNTIALDVGQAKDITTNGLARVNPDRPASELRNAQGAGRIAHEASNESTMRLSGQPTSKAGELQSEQEAFGAEADVFSGLGMNTRLLAPGEIGRASGQAADSWCNSAHDIGYFPQGC